jgi:hypothetical protein
MHHTLWSVIVSLVVVLTAWHAEAVVLRNPIITAPGTFDLDRPWTQGIVIRASKVTLDCHWHPIEGQKGIDLPGRGIFAINVDEVTIKRCEVSNWNVGISLNGGSKHQLIGVSAHHNFYGVTLTQTDRVDILPEGATPDDRSWVFSNEHGIYLTKAFTTQMQRLELTDNRQTGLSAYDGVYDVTLEHGHVAMNGHVRRTFPHVAGFYLSYSTRAVVVKHSVFVANGPEDAICNQGCHIVKDCRAERVTLDDMTFVPRMNICDPEHACTPDGSCPIF